MSNDDIVDTLNDLIETCKDGEYGFNACAQHTQNSELRTVFLQRAVQPRPRYDGTPCSGIQSPAGALPVCQKTSIGMPPRGYQ